MNNYCYLENKGTRTLGSLPAFSWVKKGAKCPSITSSETRECARSCKVDCKVGAWSSWSSCPVTCGGAEVFRTRSVIQTASNGGAECPAKREAQPCAPKCCPLDCVLKTWAKWGSCSKSCGTGIQTRLRGVHREPKCNGAKCAAKSESRECNRQCCPVDGVLNAWTEWSKCSEKCGTGHQYRVRTVRVAANCGGKPPPSDTYRSRVCNRAKCPCTATVGAWNSWTAC